MHWTDTAAVYHPRKPTASPLWQLIDDHFPEFLQHYDDRFVREYGILRPVVLEVVQGFLRCGDLSGGFARVRCPDCHHEYLLAFSCRGRWFCPSCHAKKVILFDQHLRDKVLYPVPHRQYVFSIPIILRRFFKYDRKLLGKLCRSLNQRLLKFFRTATGLKSGALGAVIAMRRPVCLQRRISRRRNGSKGWAFPTGSPTGTAPRKNSCNAFIFRPRGSPPR